MRRLALALVLLAAMPAAAHGGGAPWAYVTVGQARVALLDLDAGRVARVVGVPAGATRLAATVDGRRVVVVSPASGSVTLVDAVAGRVVRRLGRFVRPVDVAVSWSRRTGFVGSREAFVADAGSRELVTLDLAGGRVVSRLRLPGAPQRVIVTGGGALLVAVGERGELVDVRIDDARHPRVTQRLHLGSPVAAATADLVSGVTYVALRDGDLVALGPNRSLYRHRVRARVSGLALDDAGRLWLVDAHAGRAIVARASDGRVLGRVRIPPGVTDVETIGGWLAWLAGERFLRVAVPGRLVEVPPPSRWDTIRLPSTAHALAYAVLP